MNNVDLIREHVDVLELFKSLGIRCANVTADEAFILCPFHKETSPSLAFNLHSKVFHCFGCGEGGDVFSFVMKLKGLSFKDALAFLKTLTGSEDFRHIEICDRITSREYVVRLVRSGKLRKDFFLFRKDGSKFDKSHLKLCIVSDIMFSFFMYAARTSDEGALSSLEKKFLKFFRKFNRKFSFSA